MQDLDNDPFKSRPSPWGVELCRRLMVVEHPIIQQLVAREDHEQGGLGSVLFEDLASELVRIMIESPDGANDPEIDRVLDIVYEWLDFDNPHQVNDFSASFMEYLEHKGSAGKQILDRLREEVRGMRVPQDFPRSYPPRRAFEEAYERRRQSDS